MMKKHRIYAGMLVISMLMCLFAPVFADGDIITISNEDDLIKFSKNCTLDTWSQGKTVNLTCDIELDSSDFTPIPIFSGTFNGNGYTISGLKLSRNGSDFGLFRYIEKGGKITNLNIKGSLLPDGSKCFIGGIAGENSGIIEKCNVDVRIKGENAVGGIAGKNTDSGQILSCTSSGNITGESFTGGITGENLGLILSCTNNAEVNTKYEEKKKDLSSINTDAGAIVESYKRDKEEGEENSILGHTDTGGIVGYSSGVVQGCTNNAAVGYQHTGYNVGGIAGRQSGYLLGCTNNGAVQGRKDVGGIAGQIEPYILLNASEDTLNDIRTELDRLHSMVNNFIDNTDAIGDNTEKHLNKFSDLVKNAQNNAETMLNTGTDFIDDNLGEINAQTAIISNTLDKLTPVFDDLEKSTDDFINALDDLSSALDSIELYAPDLHDEIENISSATGDISSAERSLNNAIYRARRAVNELNSAVKFNNKTQAHNSILALSTAVKDIITAKTAIKTSLDNISAILKNSPFPAIKNNIQELTKNITAITENVTKSISAMQTITQCLDILLLNTEIDLSEYKTIARNINSSVEYLEESVHFLTRGLSDLGNTIQEIFYELEDYIDDMSDQLNTANDNLSNAVSSLSDASDDIKNALDSMKQIISDLSDEKPLEFVKLGDDFRDANENLFNSLSDISGELDGLKNTVSNGKNTITSNLNSISNQFNVIMNLMANGVDELKTSNKSISDIFLDVSDDDIENTTQGKIAECQNYGKIEADRNTGGIAGAMAIEYAKDPEDDIEKPDTLNFTYITKAILQSCTNDGEITGKKDCTGGIAGLAEIGTIYECENYGDIKSTSGNYIGGVAGESRSTIRRCYSKCRLEGKRYVGGIAGKADNMTACCSIVNVDGDECTGAISGMCDNRERLSKNLFVDNGLGAVDGISYKNSAEPISFDELKNITGIPLRFIGFTVTFTADGKVIETQEIRYGDDTSLIKYPKIPEKDGYFGNWQSVDSKTITENLEITCEYTPYITVLASNEKNDSGKLSLALAEGEFTDKAALHVIESAEPQPAKTFGNTAVYDILLSNTDIQPNDIVKIRILNENRDHVTAWCKKDGEWKQLDTEARGKYVILTASGAKNTICLQYTKAAFNFLWLIVLALAAGIITLLVVRIKRKPGKQHTSAAPSIN